MDCMTSFDGRVMNHMSPETKLVHARLERWGRWAKTAGVRAWPPVTLLGRVMDCGPDGALARGSGRTEVPDDVAEVDTAVAKLGEVDRRVIRVYYLEWLPPESMAKNLRMKLSQFNAVLSRARFRVSVYLERI